MGIGDARCQMLFILQAAVVTGKDGKLGVQQTAFLRQIGPLQPVENVLLCQAGTIGTQPQKQQDNQAKQQQHSQLMRFFHTGSLLPLEWSV